MQKENILIKITTKKGDSGYSSTLIHRNIPKNCVIFERLGGIDELMSFIGCIDKETFVLKTIQSHLKEMCDEIATGKEIFDVDERTEFLDALIDGLKRNIELIDYFVLPNNEFHILRTVCRRIERSFFETKYMKYLNRLSDVFYLLAIKEYKENV